MLFSTHEYGSGAFSSLPVPGQLKQQALPLLWKYSNNSALRTTTEAAEENPLIYQQMLPLYNIKHQTSNIKRRQIRPNLYAS